MSDIRVSLEKEIENLKAASVAFAEQSQKEKEVFLHPFSVSVTPQALNTELHSNADQLARAGWFYRHR